MREANSRNVGPNDEQMRLNSNTFDKMTKYEKFLEAANARDSPMDTIRRMKNTSSKNTAYDNSHTGRATSNMRPKLRNEAIG